MRSRRRLRDLVAVGWLTAAVVVSLTHVVVPMSGWLMIHLVLLGALTHSALVWSEHFTQAVLRSRRDERDARTQDARILVLAAGGAAVMTGVPTGWWWLVVVGATAVTTAVLWHGVHLVRALRSALPTRFRVVVRSYVAAALCLPVGAAFGAALAFGLPEDWHGRLLVAHIVLNVLGWIGLTVTGTLVTFWPTMLRARMDARAERLAGQALPAQLAGIAVVVTGALLDVRWLAVAGLVLYVLALVWWGRALAAPLRVHGLREFAPAAVLAALVWALVALVWITALMVTGDGWNAVADHALVLGGVVAVGFAAQLLPGALSYLVPSVLGGGPSVVRAGRRWFERWATWRLAVVNLGLLLWLLPVPTWVRVAVSVIVLAALAAFIPLLVLGAKACAQARRAAMAPGARPAMAAQARPAAQAAENAAAPRFWRPREVVAAGAVLLLAAGAGVAVDPAAAGLPFGTADAAAGVTPTGHTTRVEVDAHDMRFTPNRISVPAGDRLVVVVRNTDSARSHDLVIGRSRTPRLAPGQRAELDAGVIGASAQGWCSIAGHKQMGMVLDIAVTGAVASGAGASEGVGTHMGHMGGTDATGTSEAGGAIPLANPAKAPATTIDPRPAPAPSGRVHRRTLRVTEVAREVAPGLWQKRWTFGGESVGPTLHGKVGDTFVITLVNDGTMGHSIDFHAGALAPDRPMRTIEPGQRLTYRFTATRAGIWMYHCSTMPMSAHIAAGMHGAVIIDPPGLPRVDREYALVQSEVYLANAATDAKAATELDTDKVNAERPDRVVFNGIANQYDAAPLKAKVGERVRIWVLDAGPNRASSFHVVGGQFDTTWTEGRYLIGGPGAGGGASSRAAGAQVLPLLPAQGGFVEMTFPEPGHYPAVSHVMVDAERGAHAVVDVTR